MAFTRLRVAIVVIVFTALGAGFALGVSGVDVSPLWLSLGAGTVCGLAMLWYYRKQREAGEVDERYVRIQGRAAMGTMSVLIMGLATLAAVIQFTDVDVPVAFTLWGFVFGAIILDEVFIEVCRRRM